MNHPAHPARPERAIPPTEDLRCRIAYLIPHLPQSLNDASMFGWYTEGIHAAARPILIASGLPADIREAHTEPKHVLVHRLLGTIWPMITPIETTSLGEALAFLPTPFRVCISTTPEVADIVDAHIAASPWPILHASDVMASGRTPLASLDVATVSNYVNRVLESLAHDPKFSAFVRAIRRELTSAPRRKAKKHPLKAGLHNVVLPNERALEAFGRKLLTVSRISDPIGTNHDSSRYVSRICDSADAVRDERRQLVTNTPPEIIDNRLILGVASVYWGIHRNWRGRLQKLPESQRKNFKLALKNVVHANTYFEYVPTIEMNGKPALLPAFAVIAEERAKDALAFTATLSLLSTSTLSPVLRLEPKINAVRDHVRQLAHCVRVAAKPRYEWKASRMSLDLGRQIRDLVDPKFLERIDAPEDSMRIEGIKIVADAPLEFLRTNGLPLGLRFDSSRISPIPGNLSLQIASISPIRIPRSSLYEVLILRSFSATDSLRNMLEMAINAGESATPLRHVRHRFVDVSSEAEVIEALNGHTGAIVIFDCHGSYSDEDGLGYLVIGGTQLNFWGLRGKCHLPPIVMFSACDTQPIDGSHGSVATSAFVLGARTVLATYFPVLATHAAMFNARLLLRIDAYIPAALATREQVTWREVVSGMLRMMYVTEVQLRLQKEGGVVLSRESMERVQHATTQHISVRDPHWHEVLLETIAHESGLDVHAVQTLIDRLCSLTDAMKYVQLGNPERIIITNS